MLFSTVFLATLVSRHHVTLSHAIVFYVSYHYKVEIISFIAVMVHTLTDFLTSRDYAEVRRGQEQYGYRCHPHSFIEVFNIMLQNKRIELTDNV